MRVARVRLPFDPLELEGDTDLRADGSHSGVDFCRPRLAAEFLLEIRHTWNTLHRQIRVELERMPADGGREIRLAGAQSRQRGFELALADVAPGADNVGDDVDKKRRSNEFGRRGGRWQCRAHRPSLLPPAPATRRR